MNILLISAFPPSLDTAGQAFTYRLIEKLSLFHKVDCISFSEFSGKHKNFIGKTYSINFLTRLVGILFFPFLHPIFSSRFSLRKAIHLNKYSKNYDLIIFNFSQVFIYSIFVIEKKIFICHDVISQNLSRKKGLLNKFLYLFGYYSEFLLMRHVKGKVFTFSDKDCLLLDENFKVASLPINFYIDPLILSTPVSEINRSASFVLYGAWGRPENSNGLLWFIKNVLPIIEPHYKFEIIGKGIPKNILNLIALHSKNFILHGYVENPYSIINKSKALIAPLFEGAGVKVKVIETLSLGIPVIGTPIAFEGISANLLDKSFTCNSAPEFANAIINFAIPSSHDIKNSREYFFDMYSRNTLDNFIKTDFYSD